MKIGNDVLNGYNSILGVGWGCGGGTTPPNRKKICEKTANAIKMIFY